MSGLIPLGCGAVCGVGLFVVIREFLPGRPRLASALTRLSANGQSPPDPVLAHGLVGIIGVRARRFVPVSVLRRAGPADSDLELIGKSATRHAGEKALAALTALIAVPAVTVCAVALGVSVDVPIPAGVCLMLALAAWFAPDLAAKASARRARQTFARAVSTYLELLAIERISGAGATQATFGAATVARSWPFRRIHEALERGRWEGVPPWQALRMLATDLDVPELRDAADILELAGTAGSAIHEQLQSRAAAMRDAQLDVEQQLAHDATVRMAIPGTLTVLVYFLMLIYPMLSQMLRG